MAGTEVGIVCGTFTGTWVTAPGAAGVGGAPPLQAASRTRLLVPPASIRKLRRDSTRTDGRSGVRSSSDGIGRLLLARPERSGRY